MTFKVTMIYYFHTFIATEWRFMVNTHIVISNVVIALLWANNT